jgi:hypothetical protein
MVAHLESLLLFLGFILVIGYLVYRKKGIDRPFEETKVTLDREDPESVSSISALGFLERKSAREGVSAFGYTVSSTPADGNVEQYVWTRFSPRLGLTFDQGNAKIRRLKKETNQKS